MAVTKINKYVPNFEFEIMTKGILATTVLMHMINDFKFSFSKQQCRQGFITVCICFWEYHPFLC